MKVNRSDALGRLDAKKQLGDGSGRYSARLTRTGILEYPQADGSVVYELRPAEEVFNQESLDSLRAVTVTLGHPATINADNWRDYAVGHVGDNVHEDGIYVASDLIVKDPRALAGVDNKDLVELSCGYTVDLDFSPGEYEGQKYDAIQRNIRYNHVGIGGESWGRAGPQVRVLDGTSLGDMSLQVNRVDAPTNPATPAPNTDATQAKIDALTSERDTARTVSESANARADKAEAKADAASAKADDLQVKLDAANKSITDSAADIDARVNARVSLLDTARKVLGAEFTAKTPEGKPMSDREVHIAVISKHDPKFDAKDRKDGYLEARFELVSESVTGDRKVLADVAGSTAPAGVKPATVVDGGNTPPATKSFSKAQEDMNTRNAKAWTTQFSS